MSSKATNKEKRKNEDKMEKEELEKFLNYQESYMQGWLSSRIHHDSPIMFLNLLQINEKLAQTRTEKSTTHFLLRAICYRLLGFYHKAFQNIQLASDYGAPASIVTGQRDKVACEIKREMKDFHRESKEEDYTFFKLSYEPNEKIPALASCIALRENDEFGRHIITNRDLKAGDIVGITEAFFKSFHREALYYQCSYCFKQNLLDLIACPFCMLGELSVATNRQQ